MARIDASYVVHCFLRYLDHSGLRVSRAEFEESAPILDWPLPSPQPSGWEWV